MYERHFGLRTRPFSILPQAEFLYPCRRHRMALELLSYGIVTRAPFVVVGGEIGTGKTTLIRCLSGRIPGDTLAASSSTCESRRVSAAACCWSSTKPRA